MANLKLNDLITALGRSDDETLSRVICEGLLICAKRGRESWEELFAGLSSVNSDDQDEIAGFLAEWLDSREVETGETNDDDQEIG